MPYRRNQIRTPSRGGYANSPVRQPQQTGNNSNNEAIKANEIAAKANKLTIWAILVNIILMFATFMLYMLTREATTAATKSANAAENTYKEQRYNDSILLYRDSVKNHNDRVSDAIASVKQGFKDSVNRERDSARFELERTSTQAQIDAVKQQVSSFYAINRPYLQVTHVMHLGDTPSGFHQLQIVIANLGNYPVKLSTSTLSSMTAAPVSNPYNTYFKDGGTSLDVKIYISNNTPNSLPITVTSKALYNRINGTQNDKASIYVYGNFKYKNLITNSAVSSGYEFLIEVFVSEPDRTLFKFLKNENY